MIRSAPLKEQEMMSEQMIKMKLMKIYPLYFPTKTTHILQSCDDGVFQSFKSYINLNYQKQMMSARKYEPICLNLLKNYEELTNVLTKGGTRQTATTRSASATKGIKAQKTKKDK